MEKEGIGDKEFLKKLGNRIKTIRKEKHLRQTELGYLCDIEKQSMNRIERGDTNPTALTLRKLAIVLEIDIAEFFTNL